MPLPELPISSRYCLRCGTCFTPFVPEDVRIPVGICRECEALFLDSGLECYDDFYQDEEDDLHDDDAGCECESCIQSREDEDDERREHFDPNNLPPGQIKTIKDVT
jgi:hypothetical protein